MNHRLVAPPVLSVVAVATAVAVTNAQAPTPTLNVDLGPNRVTVAGGGAGVPAGPTRIVLRNTSRRGGPAESALAALRPGVTLAQVRTALRRAQRGPTPLKRLLTFQGSGSVPANGTFEATVELRPGTTYLVARIGENPANSPLTTFTVAGQSGGGTAPAPDATVGVYDYAFGMPATLPRQGTVRFENRGERLHFAIAFPVRRGANRAAAVKALIANDERRLGRLASERQAIEPLGVISGGQAINVDVRFPRTGNWVFACFIADGEPGNPGHNELGMVKAFRVR